MIKEVSLAYTDGEKWLVTADGGIKNTCTKEES